MWQRLSISGRIIVGLGVYSLAVVAVVATLVLGAPGKTDEKVVIKMMLGALFAWVVVCGGGMLLLRRSLRRALIAVPLGWKTRFVLACTALALVEEGITTTMTNLAPVFGSSAAAAHITASTNYLHVVLFHSVILFVPMFVAWALMLARLDFTPAQVFLLFGAAGSLMETTMNPTSALGGFWFFVYGLMVWIPAYSLPDRPGARPPKAWQFALAVALPMLFIPLTAFPASLARKWLDIPLFTS